MQKIAFFLLTVLFLSSCSSSVEVLYDYDKTADFSSFRTFSFYPWDYKHGFQLNDYDKQTIYNAIRSELEKKGYRFTEENGDLVVSIFVTIEGKTSYEAYTNHYGGWAGYGGGWGYYGFGYGYSPGYSTTTVTRRDYKQGTLIIDVFSAADKKLIWQGIGSREVEYNLETRDERLPKDVAEILKWFPEATNANEK